MHFDPLTITDRIPVIDLFNYYIENSFAAYPEQKVSYDFFDLLLKAGEGYPTLSVKEPAAGVIGFGMLRPYHPFPVFSRTAEISYFIAPEWTGRGIGEKMLSYLLEKGKDQGLSSILASISSLNPGSLRFHQKNGFKECGRLQKVGEKQGQVFDVVYMQRFL
ncbi:MAG: N-acetyltransferase family protein [Thermodesulfobacteriota bacterium]